MEPCIPITAQPLVGGLTGTVVGGKCHRFSFEHQSPEYQGSYWELAHVSGNELPAVFNPPT